MAEAIQKIQLKRGAKKVLELVLKGDNKPALGEPIFETDTGKLKIGDGINDYKDVTYFSSDAKAQQLVFNNIYELPSVGEVGTIYIVKNGNTYVWDSEKTHYRLLYVDNRQFYALTLDDNGEIIGAERQIDAGNATADYSISDFIYEK